MGEMKTFRIPFKKVVFGFGRVKAKNIDEAKSLSEGDFIDEFDNKSEYEFFDNDVEEVE